MSQRPALMETVNEVDGRVQVPPPLIIVHIAPHVEFQRPICGTTARIATVNVRSSTTKMVICDACLDEIRSMG